MSDQAFFWLVALPLLASPLVYFGGHVSDRKGPWSIPQLIALLALAGTWVPFGLAVRDLRLYGGATIEIGSIPLVLDGLGLLLAATTLALGTMVVVFSGSYMAQEAGQEKYYAMLVAMVGVMIGLGFANDLFNLWIWFEAMAICSYLLVAFYREQPTSLEAGVKYLVQSAAGSVLVLLGIGLVLGQVGSLNLTEIRQSAPESPVLFAAGALFVIGFGVKAALAPLHTWLPDAHSRAPSGISAMLSGVVIEAGLIAMLRSLSPLTSDSINWGPLLMAFGALNMLVGNLMALRQREVKRLLAYSSLTHVGYMLIGVGIAIYAGEANGAQGGLFHLLNHGLMKGLAFLAAGAMLYALHLAMGNHQPLILDDLSGAARRYPVAALALSLAVLGLAGLPPLAGFMSKWQIFLAGFQTQNALIGGVMIFAALMSVLSLAYYAPLVNRVYRHQPSPAVQSGISLPGSMNFPLILLSLAILAIGVWPSMLEWLTGPAGASLLEAFTR